MGGVTVPVFVQCVQAQLRWELCDDSLSLMPEHTCVRIGSFGSNAPSSVARPYTKNVRITHWSAQGQSRPATCQFKCGLSFAQAQYWETRPAIYPGLASKKLWHHGWRNRTKVRTKFSQHLTIVIGNLVLLLLNCWWVQWTTNSKTLFSLWWFLVH